MTLRIKRRCLNKSNLNFFMSGNQSTVSTIGRVELGDGVEGHVNAGGLRYHS